jgi:hypothetical protein
MLPVEELQLFSIKTLATLELSWDYWRFRFIAVQWPVQKLCIVPDLDLIWNRGL